MTRKHLDKICAMRNNENKNNDHINQANLHVFFMSYKEAQKIFKEKYGVIPKSSWIADIRSEHGKTKGPSKNRPGDYKYPCPKQHRANLTKILKSLKMIQIANFHLAKNTLPNLYNTLPYHFHFQNTCR